MRTLKLILRNTIIYSLVFTMFFGSAITNDTVSLVKEVIAEASGNFDGQIDVGNPQSATGGIISNPCYAYPGIKISVLYDENTKLITTQGIEAFYQYWGNKYPVTTGESNMVQGSFYMITRYEDFRNRGVTESNLHSFKYNGGDLIDEGPVGGGGTPARFLTSIGASSFGASGVFYDAIKNVDKGILSSNWKAYASNVTRAQAAWYKITAVNGEGGHGNTTSFGVGASYNEIFNPNGLDLNTEQDFTSDASKELWYRNLDALMSLWAIAPDSVKPIWETAVNNHINGAGAAIMCEVCPVMVFNSRTANEYFGVVTAMDYISYCTGVTSGNLIYGQNWYNTNSSFTGDIYGAITHSVNSSIAESPDKDRYPSTGHYKTNAWSWGLTALTRDGIKTSSSGLEWYGGTVPTAFVESLGISNGGSGNWKAGYTIFGTSGAAPLSVDFGVLSATPDNYHCGQAVFGTNVSLTLYGGISEEDLGAWDTIIKSAEQTGGNFTIKVDWTRDSGRETDGCGIGTFIDPDIAATDPFKPENSQHLDPNVDSKAPTVVNNPTIVVFSPSEMKEWISGRRAITAYDAIANYKVMHTNTKIDYTAHINITFPNGENKKGTTSDAASFLMHEERIGYASTPQAYSEFKNYGVTSNLDGYLKEDFEAMGGVPSTEQMYFAAGGSEFIVDIGLNEAADETAYRTYDYYYSATDCEYKVGDQSNETFTVPSYSGILGAGSDYTISVHGGNLTVSQTISGSIRNDAVPVTGVHSATCTAIPNAGDLADRQSAYASLVAWYNSAMATVITHTSASDQVTRTGTLSSMGGSYNLPGCPSNVPASTSASAPCQAKPAQGTPGMPGYVPAIPCANEQCTASPSGAASWSVTASITIPCHVICGPCCEHVIPETHDTWRQTTKYDSMEINNIHIWRIDQGAIEGMEEILDLEYVSVDVLDDHPTVFYNIAQKNEDMKTYKNPVYGDTYKGAGKYSHHAKVGRMVYDVERDMGDNVVVCLGSRDPFCDGLAQTCGHNKIPTTAAGHGHFWAEGFIYTESNEGFNTGRTGNTKNGETAFLTNPRNALNGSKETFGANLSLNYVTEHTNKRGSWDSKDWNTKEYRGFVEKRNQQVTATMVTDFLILQTTSGAQSVMYFDQSQSTYVDAEMPNIDALGHPYNYDDGGAHGNEVGSIDATAIPGGPISKTYWYGNPNCASNWSPFEINIGSYTGMYWKGNEGNNGGGSTKFDGTGRNNAKPTQFDDGPHGSMVMARPKTANKLMMYDGELNLKLDLVNQAYYTDYSEVFFANQLHWAYDDWLRINPEKDGLHLPYITKDGTSDYANFARLDTGSFVFDGDTPGISYFFYDTNNHAKSYVGSTGNAIGKDQVTKADHQFNIEDYRVAAGYTQKAVYSDSTVGGNDYPKCNDIIIHDPVSTQDTALVSLPQYRDQRTGDVVGGAADVTESINNSIECPKEPGLCEFRVLNCHFLEDQVIFKSNFTPDAAGNFVNSITGNSLTLQPGFTLDKNNTFDNYALRAYGTRLSIPFTEMELSYNTSTKVRVEADIVINPTGKDQMIFSFNSYDLYLPASTEQGINENRNLTINTGNGWELKASIPVADGKKHHLAVDFAFNNPDNCAVYVDGKKATLQRFNNSVELTPNSIGTTLNIGSWGRNDNYGASFWLDNLTVTRLAGTMSHGKECYSVQMQHVGGNNAHNHTAACLDSLTNTVAPGMITKEIDGKLWGRVFWHNMSGGFFKNSNEVLNTNQTYKYSVLDYIQKLKPQNEDKYTFRLEYGNVVSNIWKQTNRPQDESLPDTTTGSKVTGYEAISIPHNTNYWGGLARSTTNSCYIDGSVGHSNWWFSIGTYKAHVSNTTFPGYNSTNVNECSLWMLLDDSYRKVDESEVTKTFNYTGNVQEYTVPITGYYRLEAWGASSDPTNSMAGKGGYTAGTVYLTAGTKLYIYVGEAGKYVATGNNIAPATFNGGGAGGRAGLQLGGHQGASGGGASDIRLAGGPWNNTASLQTRLLVAGGGGGRGCASNHNPGDGGGLVGATTRNPSGNYAGASASGGSQTAGGRGVGSFSSHGTSSGGFGYGATAAQCAAGGGGGYYGGGSEYTAGGGGGSSYVNGYPGCNTKYYNKNYTFTNVALTQGGNVGNGKVQITRMTSTLANVLYWIYSGERNEEELRELLGDAYDYVIAGNKMTELHTYSNWSNSNNGFYHLTNGVTVDINNDGSFIIDTANGYECGSAVDIDGSALRNIVITYKGSNRPETGTGIQFVLSDGTTSKYYAGDYSVNENGDAVCTVKLDTALFGTHITDIRYDLGSGLPTTKRVTVKSIQLNGFGTTRKETRTYRVSQSNVPGTYTHEANAFGNALFDVEVIGARGGDARIVNTNTVVKKSGGIGANVFAQIPFGKNDSLKFTVGGKGGDQASTNQIGGLSGWIQVINRTTAGNFSFTMKAGKLYKVEMYGGSGGSGSGYGHTTGSAGGYGGYSQGIIQFDRDTTVYGYAGGQGAYGNGTPTTFNGGGAGGSSYSGAGGGASHLALANGTLASLNGNRSSILMVAGGGGGADNAGSSPGGSDDGSGGNGGGTTAQGAWIAGGYYGGYGATQTSGYAFGQGQNGNNTDTGGGGGGYFGGKSTHNNNGGAGGGSGYINTTYVKSLEGVSAVTQQSNRVGCGIIRIYEAEYNPAIRIDGAGGYNGGGTGGIEYQEGQPESAAGGGGATDLKVNGAYTLVAGGGGGAGSHLTANATTEANGGSASTLTQKGVATNSCTEAGTPQGGYSILSGQNGADGVRANNYGAVGGAGGGYYGGKQIKTNTSSMAIGGAGGGSYASQNFSKLSSVLKESSDGTGNGQYTLDEYRETLVIRETNYDETSAQILMQYYTLIPDKLPDGSPNPLWSNCKGEGNYHKCTSACKELKVLTCSEPHHQGLHYDVSNKICWEACMNDANHRKSYDKVEVDTNYSFDVGNFINIDYGLTIFFPNRGDFYEGESYGIGALTSSKGLGFRDKYEVDEDYSDLPYGRGTDMSGGYVNTYVGMNTSKWTRVKRIKLPVNVIYDPTRDGKHAKLYLAGEWITLGDRGTYTAKIGGQGDSADKGKYDEKAWSKYGTWEYEGVYREFYNFYCVLDNPEMKAAAYTVEVTALNAKDFNGDGDAQKNDNPDAITNKMRTSSFHALHGGTNTRYFDVVGRIGNMIMEDVEDFRFSNLFKQALVQEEQTQLETKTYYANNGLGIRDSLNTENEGATVNDDYVTTNQSNAFAAVKGVDVDSSYYKVVFEGRGLNVGRFEAVDIRTKQPIPDDKIKLIQESSRKVICNIDLSEMENISEIDLKFIAKGANVMAVSSCTFTKLGSSPDSWLLDGIVREVDETKQNIYFTWVSDIRGIKVGTDTHYVDTWGTLTWVNDKWKDFPLSPDKNNISILRDEPMLAGYSALLDIQTIGSYWKNDIGKLQIVPKYYALDVDSGIMKKLDVYMEHEGEYVPINLADNVNKGNKNNPFNSEIFDNQLNLDWENTKARRNVTELELSKTQQVYEESIRKDSDVNGHADMGAEDIDTFRPIDIPNGNLNILGNNQYMELDGNARSFVGGVETYGVLKNLGNRLNPVHWYRSAQRWHFLVGVPSSAVFVLHGQQPSAKNIDALQSGPYIILCTLDITAKGEIYALKYEHKYSGSNMAKDYNKYYQNIVKDWTDQGTSGGSHMGTIQVISNEHGSEVTKTIDLNQYAEQLDYEPIILVYSVNERSVQDVEIIGTH